MKDLLDLFAHSDSRFKIIVSVERESTTIDIFEWELDEYEHRHTIKCVEPVFIHQKTGKLHTEEAFQKLRALLVSGLFNKKAFPEITGDGTEKDPIKNLFHKKLTWDKIAEMRLPPNIDSVCEDDGVRLFLIEEVLSSSPSIKDQLLIGTTIRAILKEGPDERGRYIFYGRGIKGKGVMTSEHLEDMDIL